MSTSSSTGVAALLATDHLDAITSYMLEDHDTGYLLRYCASAEAAELVFKHMAGDFPTYLYVENMDVLRVVEQHYTDKYVIITGCKSGKECALRRNMNVAHVWSTPDPKCARRLWDEWFIHDSEEPDQFISRLLNRIWYANEQHRDTLRALAPLYQEFGRCCVTMHKAFPLGNIIALLEFKHWVNSGCIIMEMCQYLEKQVHVAVARKMRRSEQETEPVLDEEECRQVIYTLAHWWEKESDSIALGKSLLYMMEYLGLDEEEGVIELQARMGHKMSCLLLDRVLYAVR